MVSKIRSALAIALRALGRNRLQTVLTMVGITIGVAAVLTMVALGTGAESAIEQQVRAAGLNLIVVTAGNYKMKTEDDFGGVVDHQARLDEGTQRPERQQRDSAIFARPAISVNSAFMPVPAVWY